MAREIRYSRLAAEDLAAIRRWLQQPGAGDAACRRLRSILAAIDGLAAAPLRHRTADHPGSRRLTIARHVVIYRVLGDTGDNATAGDVLILRVFGPGQQHRR